MLTFPVVQVATAISEPSIEDKSLAIMSDVFGLDLSKYNVTLKRLSGSDYCKFGAGVKQYSVDYTLISGKDRIDVSLMFENGHLWYCILYPFACTPIYVQSPSPNILEQSRSVISRYQVFAAQNYASDTSYLSTMATMLNSVSELKSTYVTAGNTKLNISLSTPRFIGDVPSQRIRWSYTENGVDMPIKAVSFKFTNGSLNSIWDAWDLYTIGSYSSISREEALDIALSAAQNLKLKFVAEDDSIFEVKPDLSHITSKVFFSMSPRNSTTLYPFWAIEYYFDEPIYSDYGIQVGIWGDTKQVAFCQSLTTLGDYPPTSTAQSAGNVVSLAVPLAVAGAIILVVAISAVVVIKKRRSK
jgi:hypothetical protein